MFSASAALSATAVLCTKTTINKFSRTNVRVTADLVMIGLLDTYLQITVQFSVSLIVTYHEHFAKGFCRAIPPKIADFL
jgi:hypothetical protein